MASQPQSKLQLIDSLDENDDAVYDTVRLGQLLGFLTKTEEGIDIADLGSEVIAEHGRPRKDVYTAGVKNHEAYCQILGSLDEKGVIFEGPLERETVLSLLEEDYDLDLSTKTLKERVGTFFATLEAAGLGEYIFASANTICHFRFDEGFRDRLPTASWEPGDKQTGEDKKSDGSSVQDKMQPGSKDDRSESKTDSSMNVFAGSVPADSDIQATITGEPIDLDVEETDLPTSSGDTVQYSLSINIDESTDPDHLEELVLAVRRAIQTDI